MVDLTALDWQILRTAQTGMDDHKAVEWVFTPHCIKADWSNLVHEGYLTLDGLLTPKGRQVGAFEQEVISALKEGGKVWFSAVVGNSYLERSDGSICRLDLTFAEAMIKKHGLVRRAGAGLWYVLPTK